MTDLQTLVEQVEELTDATTDLLEATNVSKQTLDQAVDSATGSASSASHDADSAKEDAATAVSARNEAVAAKNDAEAIVHQGEGSTTPGGGKYPVAYADGQIDSGWLPEFRARFPYSGVIGSVDKGDLFSFSQTEVDSDKCWVKEDRAFNIAGRFVKTPYNGIIISLPDAESTAARAIAFDDVFLDWNGNVDSFRSITPHRTTTGYDTDAIATEHGYTKVSTGLYRKDGSYSLLLCRVARRNKGGFHPLWNPEGASTFWSHTSENNSTYTWYETNAKKVASEEDCFNGEGEWNNDPDSPPFVKWSVENGSIERGSNGEGRSDEKYYDAIYADDVTPLYYSAQNVVDRQALLFDLFNKAVAGETFMGAEGTTESSFPTESLGDNIHEHAANVLVAVRGDYGDITDGDSEFFDGAEPITETLISIEKLDNAGGSTSSSLKIRVDGKLYYSPFVVAGGAVQLFTIPAGTLQTMSIYNDRAAMKITILRGGFKKDSARPQFLSVDIIGSLDAMPQEWLDNGLPGNWLAVGEEGEDLIPETGVNKDYKVSRKCLECYLVLHTANRGQSWDDYTSAWKEELESEANARNARINDDRCLMIFYRTAANPFELSKNSDFIEISRHPVALNGGNHSKSTRPSITERMIGKVPVSPSSSYIGVDETYGLIYYGSSRQGFVSERVEHQPFVGNLFGKINPCAKHFSILVERGEWLYLQIVYKEMKYSGEQWGDDNKFSTPSYQTTITDLNGEQVIVGQKRCALPYHCSGDTY